MGPEVEGVAGVAALEAVEDILVEVCGEAASGAGSGAVQRARSAVLGALSGAGLPAEQLEDGGDRDGGADGDEVDGETRNGMWRDSVLTLSSACIALGLAFVLTDFAGLGEFAVAFIGNGLVSSFEAILGSDVADGAVQADVVVVGGEVAHDASGVVERGGNLLADAVGLEGFVPAFDLAIGLRVVGRCLDVGHAGDADELLEILGDELGSVVGDDPRPLVGPGFAGALEDGFDVFFLHFFADFVVNDVSAAAVEDGAEEVESAGDIEVADIDVPVLVWLEGLDEAGPLLGGFGGLSREESVGFEDAIDAGRTAGGDVLVDHHEGESAITFEGMLAGEGADLVLFIVVEPVIAWDPGVVFVDFAETLLPVVELAGTDADPAEEARRGDVALLGPGADEIDEAITDVMGDPLAGQSSPRLFFSEVCSSMSSAMTSFLRWSLAS